MGSQLSEQLVDEPRAPISVTLGSSAYAETVRAALALGFRPALVAGRIAVGLVLGVGVWAVTSSGTAGLVAGLVLPVLSTVVLVIRVLVGMRAPTAPGTVVTSGYDAEGQLLLVRPTLVRRFPRGSSRLVEARGPLWLVHPMRRRKARTILVRRELLTPDDVAFLTTPPVEVAPEGSVEVTPAMQRLMWRATLLQLCRPLVIADWLLLLLIPVGCILLDPRLWPLALFSLLGIVLVMLLCRLGVQLIWRVGAHVAARVEGDTLLLHVPFHPTAVPLARVRHFRVRGDFAEVSWAPVRRWTLPLALLRADDVEALSRR